MLNDILRFELCQLKYTGLTLLIELPIFWLCGFSGKALAAFASVNVVSNLLLQEYISMHLPFFGVLIDVLMAEVVVCLLEYALCRCLLTTLQPKKLFFTVLLSNGSSFGIGYLMYW